jgi:hypothetical protein
VTTLYIYDQNGLLIAEYSEDGAWQKDYVYLNGQPLSMLVAGTPETCTITTKSISKVQRQVIGDILP